ncbi:Swarming motility protein YbiA [Anatilimnocola aggregata]|uniref:Swarming motility protein YbiA n=1 Tax=Anatilimnocola aggregata TaxID=2528021 RepID=A0A517Y579_9BACT|nr:NADAR family protein [Anatilimnocola aggregata]QDU25356.1 Swarming motility protein YbiA [Anatilimnocola aggregata]
MTEPIQFYSTADAYGEFSNFAAYPIELKGKTWPTSEHYFQAQKFAGQPDKEEIRRASSPLLAARMGRDRQRPFRTDWEAVKDSIMREAVLAKFTQHANLREILLSTGDAPIVEHTTNDNYWGDGGGSGKNMLGLILMEVRTKLREEATASQP